MSHAQIFATDIYGFCCDLLDEISDDGQVAAELSGARALGELGHLVNREDVLTEILRRRLQTDRVCLTREQLAAIVTTMLDKDGYDPPLIELVRLLRQARARGELPKRGSL